MSSSSNHANQQEEQDNNNGEGDLFGNSSLDHALLESLFYSEMMHLNGDDPNVLSQQLLSTLTADGSVVEPPPSPAVAAAAIDPNVAAEQDLLNHFGVNHNSNDESEAPQQGTKVAAKKYPSKGATGTVPARVIPLASPERQVSSLTASLAPELLPPHAALPATNVETTTRTGNNAATTTTNTKATTTAATPNPLLQGTRAPAVATSSAPAPSEEEKRSKLVNQFATLASRLGITLPNNVLQSLSQVADSTTTTTHARVPSPSPAAPQVQQLAATAEAAIASVGRKKRTRSESPPQTTSATSTAAAAAAAKRRKKPRLVECEHKLAELKAENAMLKGHLANLSAQSHQLDQERQAQEQRMRQMVTSGSTEEELNQAIQTFQDMYSDYGRRRHSELTFHLDQLLRLANPTNFTKMGLWTMGQQSKNTRNPIASILQKELEITSQQGKKIVEQREKIRRVCDNMKEVSAQRQTSGDTECDRAHRIPGAYIMLTHFDRYHRSL
eukprot:scaffold43062_cov206-Amphora_coffeaeformis.AAC.5